MTIGWGHRQHGQASGLQDGTRHRSGGRVARRRFRSGTIATLLTGRRTPDYERNDVTVYGTLGRAGLNASIDMNQAGTLAVRTDALTEDDTYPEHPFALYTKQVQAFDAAVEGNGDPLATGVDCLRVVEITLVMVESAHMGSRVSLG